MFFFHSWWLNHPSQKYQSNWILSQRIGVRIKKNETFPPSFSSFQFPTFLWIESMRQRNPMSFSRLCRASHPNKRLIVLKRNEGKKNTQIAKCLLRSLWTVFSLTFCVLICQVCSSSYYTSSSLGECSSTVTTRRVTCWMFIPSFPLYDGSPCWFHDSMCAFRFRLPPPPLPWSYPHYPKSQVCRFHVVQRSRSSSD